MNVGATVAEPNGITSEYLLKIWSIDKDTADRTIKCMTQLKKQDINGDISRNFSTNNRMS